MMTAYGSVDTAVEAMKRGAYDFVTKPLNLDKVEILIARALQSRRIEQENRSLRQQIDERYGLENILGESIALSVISGLVGAAVVIAILLTVVAIRRLSGRRPRSERDEAIEAAQSLAIRELEEYARSTKRSSGPG